jgi:hypothetical protein
MAANAAVMVVDDDDGMRSLVGEVLSRAGHGSSAALASRPRDGVASAMNALLNGYREEAELYLRVRRLTWRQGNMLRSRLDLDLFRDLLDEKEDLLRMIAQVESEMKSARSLVLSHPSSQCPDRRKLGTLLDRLTETIEEIRIIEGSNTCLLEAEPTN